MSVTDGDVPGATEPARWAVYLIECADGRVYTGVARDPERRYAMHARGKGARFTRSNRPRQLLGWIWTASHGDALRLEMAWKRLPRAARVAALHIAMQSAATQAATDRPSLHRRCQPVPLSASTAEGRGAA